MSSLSADNGSQLVLPANSFMRDGYIFIGWGLTSNGNPLYTDGQTIEVSKDLELYALWMKFDSSSESGDSSGSIDTGDIETGDTGSGESGDGSSDLPDVSEDKYTITFNSNNGEGFIPQIEFVSGNSFTLPSNEYYRVGFTFEGWSLSAGGPVEYKDNAVVNFNKSVTLYAVWKQLASYTITFHSNTNGNYSESVIVTPTSNGVKFPANKFNNGNLKFVGWSKVKGASNGDYQDEAVVYDISSDMNLYAVWDSNPVVISFDLKGGSGTANPIYAKAGDKIYLPTPDVYRDGYRLKGAYANSLDLDTRSFGQEYIVTKDVTFYVLWIALDKAPEAAFGGNSDTYRDIDVWVKGVNILKEDWIESWSKGDYYAVRKDYSGWYDTTQGHTNLCWAAASSNVLHWWHDINKDNIENYFNHYAQSDAVRPKTKYLGWGKSEIFDYYLSIWPNKGYYIDRSFEWYFLGIDGRKGGAFYKDVFGDNYNLLLSYPLLKQKSFNEGMDKAFKEGRGIIAGEVNGFGPHATTIWGAHFDKSGLIDKIYLSDSGTESGNNSPSGYETGIISIDVVYDDITGSVYMRNSMGGKIPLTAIYTLSNGQAEWEEYFKTHLPVK